MSKTNSAIVWGKTLAATAGMLSFLVSLALWNVSGRLSLQEIVYLASLTFGSLLAITGTLVPRVRSRVQGGMIIGASILILSGWTYAYSNMLELATPVAFIFSWTTVILVGGILVLLPRHHPAGPRVKSVEQGS